MRVRTEHKERKRKKSIQERSRLLILGTSGLGCCGGRLLPLMVPGRPVITLVGSPVLGLEQIGIWQQGSWGSVAMRQLGCMLG